MKTTRIRKAHRFYNVTEGLFGRNAVLAAGLGLPFVIIAANTMKNAAAISIATLCAVLPAVLVGHLSAAKAPVWARYMLVSSTALLGAYLSRFLIRGISPEIFDSLGIYLPLLAVNSLAIDRGVNYESRQRWGRGLLSGLFYCAGFALVALVMALIRELLGNGSLWGIPLSTLKLPAVLTVFSGFILLAFLAAGVRAAYRGINHLLYRMDNPTANQLKRQEAERMVD